MSCVVLVAVACGHSPKPLDADYHGTELSANRKAAVEVHAERVAALRAAVPGLDELGSSRHDECVGGQWFAEDRYYLPYVCRSTRTTLLSFAGGFEDGAAKLTAAMEANGCADGLQSSLENSLQTGHLADVTQLERSGGRPCDPSGPLEEAWRWISWSQAHPNEQQRERALSEVEVWCESKVCEAEPLVLGDVLGKVPQSDRWIAAVTSRTTYWHGKPIDG